ncbi:hypothetical protein [Sphingomonas aurantiaca]|uniref:Nmad2 family putative nucleotide modification protein n=1 Tax=Sphingomonas aurantiaca TaxID=185949 RepID=UPI00334F900A
MSDAFVYSIKYDLGFAPNPFGGLCSVACCKPMLREQASVGDWVVGFTAMNLRPVRGCVFAMIVSRILTFDEYWNEPEFRSRRPARNGSVMKMVGDNIYHHVKGNWRQEDSVHSLEDGSQCDDNTAHDTRIDKVLLSDRFVYFGDAAPDVPEHILDGLGYERVRNYRRYTAGDAADLVSWLEPQIAANPNKVLGDPFNFEASGLRYSHAGQRMI